MSLRPAVALVLLIALGCTPTASTPTPSATPSPTASSAPPAASPTPTRTTATRIQVSDAPITGSAGKLLLFLLPGQTRLRAITWDASASGVLPGEIPVNAVWSQSPYGAPYRVGPTIFDRDGRLLGSMPWPSKTGPTWSPDGTSLCAVVPERESAGAAMRLALWPIGQAVKVAATGFARYSDNAAYGVLACDPTRDRAVVGDFGQGALTLRIWVLRLSTGGIVRSVDYTREIGAWVSASSDGELLSETIPQSPLPTDRWTTTIRRADDGASLGAIGGFAGQGFSGEASLLVGTMAGKVAVVEWKSGRVVWTAAEGTYQGHLWEPAGAHLAASVLGSDRTDIYIVGSDGSSVLLPANVRTAFRY